MYAQIRAVIAEHGKMPVGLSTIGDDDDLYGAGLTSHASVNVMLGLEDAFHVEFPDEMLRKSTFETISAIHDSLVQLGATVPAV